MLNTAVRSTNRWATRIRYGFLDFAVSLQLTLKQQELRIKLLEIGSKDVALYSLRLDGYDLGITRVDEGPGVGLLVWAFLLHNWGSQRDTMHLIQE